MLSCACSLLDSSAGLRRCQVKSALPQVIAPVVVSHDFKQVSLYFPGHLALRSVDAQAVPGCSLQGLEGTLILRAQDPQRGPQHLHPSAALSGLPTQGVNTDASLGPTYSPSPAPSPRHRQL